VKYSHYSFLKCLLLTKLLAALLLTPGLLFASSSFTKGLLWKIEPAKGKPSYILGTMHSDDPRVMSLPAAIQQKFDSASSFTIEVKLDSQLAMETLALMTFSDGRNLKDILGDALYEKSSVLMASYGMPVQMVNLLKPWAVFITLSMPKNTSGQFLDKALYDAAIIKGKTIYGLESAKEQLVIFDSIPIKDQVVLLEDTVRNYEKLPAIFEEMTNLYVARDLAGLVTFNEKQMREGNTKITNRLMKKLVDERNVRMVERMAKQLDDGDAFIAVGALHLPGQRGILNLLQDKGYKISVVY